ncbi:MAG: hypothetical protein IPL87_01865 [Candidatus Moraniibacteriota bacterium]|nr:MAG: hypothetical protein IPL87_01865 [Candidatus Moranbacteria bacterium]
MRRSFSSIFVVLLSSFIGSVVCAPQSFAAPFSKEEVLRFVNEDRRAAGLPEFQENEKLSFAAERKASDMLRGQYFAHTSPQGTTPWYFFDEAGYDYRFAGENLAISFSDAKSQEEAWMASSSHRDNILSEKFRDTGIAVREGTFHGKPTLLTVTFFGTSLEEGEFSSHLETASSKTEVSLVPSSPERRTQFVLDIFRSEAGSGAFSIENSRSYILSRAILIFLALLQGSAAFLLFRFSRSFGKSGLALRRSV